MIFEISRTSIWHDEQPCKEAFKIKLVRAETRTLKTSDEFDKRFGQQEGNWLSVGTNHRYNSRGYITRDREEIDAWGIEMNSLDDIINLKNKYGEIILRTSYTDDTTLCIEIYDDYRE